MDTIPNEILEAIAAATQERVRPAIRLSVHGHPALKSEWTLSQVSHRFRDIVIGTSALWTLVETDFRSEGSVEILKLYLERSQPRGISVSLRMHDYRRNRIVDQFSLRASIVDRLSYIVPHIGRIWRLSITVPDRSTELLAPLRHLAAPRLQHLEIVKDRISLAWDSTELFSAGAPKLTVLKMDGFKPRAPLPPWSSSLTHLELWNGTGDLDAVLMLAAITEQCTSLVHLYLWLYWRDPSGDRFHIPSLKTLHLSIPHSENSDYLLRILDLFDTPALTKLIAHNAHCELVYGLFRTGSLPRTFFPALTSLSFVNEGVCPCGEDIPISETCFPPRKIFPALSSITLINQCLTPALVGYMLYAGSAWPLRTLTLCPQSDFSDVLFALRDGIQTRRESAYTIPKFRLSPALFYLIQDDFEANGVEAEIFDPTEIVSSLQYRTKMVWASRTQDIY
ncbi:hypothetical protein K438DRAFT_1802645 [Mycena galopus ATCC 62051]|nr:hypothetical protein K438DRAFT_1802645 [Mycena galopus ATCC 62051]